MVVNNLQLHKTARFQVLGPGKDNAAPSVSGAKRVSIFLDINEEYTRTRILKALSHPSRAAHFHVTLGPGHGMDEVQLPSHCSFQWSEYERIDWAAVLAGKHGASSYCVRKGLSRKAQLAHFTSLYVCKHPDSLLKRTLPPTVVIDTWPVWEDDYCGGAKDGFADIVMASSGSSTTAYAGRRQRLDKCLEVTHAAMTAAERTYDHDSTAPPPIWILKPSTINKGAGIQIVHCYEQVVDICWSESDIREWVLQRYISPPLLLQGRKFHIRAYALAVSAIRVYLSHDCLALSAGTPYDETDTSNQFAHITNTSFQDLDPNFNVDDCVRLWKEEVIAPILVQDKTCHSLSEAKQRVRDVTHEMEQITAAVFRAYQNEFGVFAPIEGCFEHYGLDFVVNKHWRVYLLEINPGPDFKQSGDRLSPTIENLMADTANVALLDQPIDESSVPRMHGRLALVYGHKARPRTNSKDNGINMRLT